MFKLLVLLVTCVFTKAEITSEKCKELFEPHSDNVYFCCFDNPKLNIGKCESFCMDETKNNCSCSNCLKENILKEKDQFLKLYDQKLNEDTAYGSMVKENWLPVISKSFEHCKPLIEIVNGTNECQFANYYKPMIDCMWQQNFLNCPESSFTPSEKCEATRKFIKEQDTCGTKYEDIFVVDISILDQVWIQAKKCNETFKEAKLNPRKCVHYPEMSPPDNVYHGCKKQCLKNECCLTPCLLNATLLDDFKEEVVKDKIIEFYKVYCKDYKIDYDIWKPVIESLFGICSSLASNVIGSKRCHIPMKFRSFALCMRQEMFLNAPKSLITDADQFEKIKTFIANETECGQKIGEKFIIHWLFWKQ